MSDSAASELETARDRLLKELFQEIGDQRVLDAIRHVPREQFVPKDLRWTAYENRPLPIGYGQTISQPLMVAMMTQALQLQGNEKVLEIGTGSGYQAALLAELALTVVTVERVAPLAHRAADRLAELGYTNVEVHVAREAIGWPEGTPYDAIVVTAAAPDVPFELLQQLADGGRLVIPVGSRNLQELVRITKTPEGAVRNNLGGCRFVPLLGKSAWPDKNV